MQFDQLLLVISAFTLNRNVTESAGWKRNELLCARLTGMDLIFQTNQFGVEFCGERGKKPVTHFVSVFVCRVTVSLHFASQNQQLPWKASSSASFSFCRSGKQTEATVRFHQDLQDQFFPLYEKKVFLCV